MCDPEKLISSYSYDTVCFAFTTSRIFSLPIEISFVTLITTRAVKDAYNVFSLVHKS